jgi:DNA replication protein DnaC
MRESLKNERCAECGAAASEEWVPPVVVGGKRFLGTGIWRSSLTNGLCPLCQSNRQVALEKSRREELLRLRIAIAFGGERPYREYTFERFELTAENQEALSAAKMFDPARSNLNLWGACGVGKTHLACAIARKAAESGRSIAFLKPPQLVRRLRLKEPDEEQRILDRLSREDILVLDDLGMGPESPYARQTLQELLEARHFQMRGGLIVTAKFSLEALAQRHDDDTIASRLGGMCRLIEVRGKDYRQRNQAGKNVDGEV